MQYTHLGRSGLEVSRLCLGTMNFGPETTEPDSFAIMDQAHRARHQLLRHRQRLRLEAGRGHHRADRRPLVRPGRRPPGEDGPRHQALRLDERLAQRHQALGPQHPARLRRLAASGCRPTTSTSTRCTTSTGTPRGTRSGRRWRRCAPQGKILYVGSSNFAGWHIAKAQETAARRNFIGLVVRAVDLQPADPRRRARGAAGGAGLRPRRHPVEPAAAAACSAASSARSARAAGAPAAGPRSRSRAPAGHRGLRGPLREPRRGAGPRRPGLAAGPAGGDRARSSARARWSSSTARCGRSRSSFDDKTLAQLDEIFPGHKTAPEDYAW